MIELIIIPNENETNLENIYHYKNIDPKLGHYNELINFIKQNNIEIKNYDKMTSYTLSLELIKRNFINLHFEGNNLIIYLSKYLSQNQVNFFKENLRIFSRYDIKIVSLNVKDEIILYENNEEEMINMRTILMKLIKKKLKLNQIKEEGLKL